MECTAHSLKTMWCSTPKGMQYLWKMQSKLRMLCKVIWLCTHAWQHRFFTQTKPLLLSGSRTLITTFLVMWQPDQSDTDSGSAYQGSQQAHQNRTHWLQKCVRCTAHCID